MRCAVVESRRGGGDDHVVYAARALSLAHAIVPALAPRAGPRVFDDPKRFLRPAHGREPAGVIPDDQDAVIERFGVAQPRTRDAAEITLHPRGVDSDGERAVRHECGGYLFFVVADVGKVRQRRADFAFRRLSFALFADVRVRFLRVDASVFDDVFHRVRR